MIGKLGRDASRLDAEKKTGTSVGLECGMRYKLRQTLSRVFRTRNSAARDCLFPSPEHGTVLCRSIALNSGANLTEQARDRVDET